MASRTADAERLDLLLFFSDMEMEDRLSRQKSLKILHESVPRNPQFGYSNPASPPGFARGETVTSGGETVTVTV